jgi:hypothetical protein
VSDEISEFFDKRAGQIVQSLLGHNTGSWSDYQSLMINSPQELPELGTSENPVEYPPIDFDSHTLVVGQWERGGSLFLVSKNVTVEQDQVTMKLSIVERDGIFVTAVWHECFWGLYPKITAKEIETVVSLEK